MLTPGGNWLQEAGMEGETNFQTWILNSRAERSLLLANCNWYWLAEIFLNIQTKQQWHALSPSVTEAGNRNISNKADHSVVLLHVDYLVQKHCELVGLERRGGGEKKVPKKMQSLQEEEGGL